MSRRLPPTDPQSIGRAELLAILEAFKIALDSHLEIFSDSSSMINCVKRIGTQLKNSLKRSNIRDVLLLLFPLLQERKARGLVHLLTKVKSHAGIPGNEAADLLATSAVSGAGVEAQIDALFSAGAVGANKLKVPKRGRSNAQIDMICLVEAAHRSEIDTAWSHDHMEMATRGLSNFRREAAVIKLTVQEKTVRLAVEVKQLVRADIFFRSILDFQSSLPPHYSLLSREIQTRLNLERDQLFFFDTIYDSANRRLGSKSRILDAVELLPSRRRRCEGAHPTTILIRECVASRMLIINEEEALSKMMLKDAATRSSRICLALLEREEHDTRCSLASSAFFFVSYHHIFTEELVARDCLARERAMFIFHTTLLNAEKLSRCAISLEAALCTPTVYFQLCYEEQMTRRRISDVQTLSSATFFAVFLRRFKKKKRDRLDEPPSPLLLLLQDEWESRGRLALDEAEVRFSMARRMRSNALPFQQKRGRDPNTTTKSQRHTRQRDDNDEDDDEDDDDEDDD